MKLSICMMVRNEAKNLVRCLDSLQQLRQALASELIIVDTGSDDNTVDIARRYTEKVYFHAWNNDFSAMRNISISYAQGEWILIIDADEELEDAANLIRFLNSTEPNACDSGYITIKSILLDQEERDYGYGTVPRLFKNDGNFKYAGVIHEQPSVKQIVDLKTTFIHYGYLSNDLELMEKKFERNARLLQAELAKDPENIYYRYQLSVTYRMHGDKKEALSEALAAYALLKKKNLKLKDNVRTAYQLIVCWLDHNEYDLAEKLCEQALKYEPENLDLHYCAAKIKLFNKQYVQSVNHYLQYLKLVEKLHTSGLKIKKLRFMTVNKVEQVYADLTMIYIGIKEFALATKYLEKVKDARLQARVCDLKVQLNLATKDFAALKAYYDDMLTSAVQGEETVTRFLTSLETQRQRLSSQDQLHLTEQFSTGSDYYAMLNQARLAFVRQDPQLERMLDALSQDFAFNPLISSDVLYFLLIFNKKIVADVLEQANKVQIEACLVYMAMHHSDLKEVLQAYLESLDNSGDFKAARVHMIFRKYLLINSYYPHAKYLDLFNQYIADGISYLTTVYTQEVLENQSTANLKDDEDAFLALIYLAGRNNVTDQEYVRLLRKALYGFPALSTGIELLLEQRRAKVEEQQAANKELLVLGQRLKQMIKEMTKSGQLTEAMTILREYKNIIKNDEDVEHLETELQAMLGAPNVPA